MAVPTSITDCNATAANNSPAGSDSIGTSLDDYLRAHAAIIRQVSDDTLHLSGGTVTGQIKGITPVSAADLTRKDYVDTMLPKAGGTVTGQIKGITPVAAEDLARKDYVDSAVSVVNTSSGTYTPTISNAVNITSLSVHGLFTYMRVGNVVSVSGNVTGSISSNTTQTNFNITIPVASNFTTAYQGTGVSWAYNATQSTSCGLFSETVNNVMTLSHKSVATGSTEYSIQFDYQVV